MFKEYVSIPRVKVACLVDERGEVTHLREKMFLYTEKVGAISERIEFYSEETPAIGDYVTSDASGYYLIPKQDFEERFRSTTYKI